MVATTSIITWVFRESASPTWHGTHMAASKRHISTVSGDFYGECVKGIRNQWQLHGDGMCCYTDGHTYYGNWVDGNPNGKGTIETPDGGVYRGLVKDGMMQGKGKYEMPDGGYSEGNWEKGRLHGQASVYKPETASSGVKRYEGGFANGMREGYGKQIIEELVRDGQLVSCSSYYTGEWSEDKWNGNGAFESQGNYKYIGKFKTSKFHGSGLLTGKITTHFTSDFPSAPIQLRGLFQEGCLVQGTITFQNGDKYTSSFGNKYDGEWIIFCIGEGTYTEAAANSYFTRNITTDYSFKINFSTDGTWLYHQVD